MGRTSSRPPADHPSGTVRAATIHTRPLEPANARTGIHRVHWISGASGPPNGTDRPLVVDRRSRDEDEGGLAASIPMPVPEIERRRPAIATLDEAGRGRARAAAQDHPHRHGRLLRVRRAARRSGAARQAGRRRRLARAGRRGGRELRGPPVRRPLRHALGHRQAEVPGADLREAAVRRLSGGLAPDPGDLRRVHAARSSRSRSTRPISTSPRT